MSLVDRTAPFFSFSKYHPEKTLITSYRDHFCESVWRSAFRFLVRWGDHSAQEDGCTCHMCALVRHKLPRTHNASTPTGTYKKYIPLHSSKQAHSEGPPPRSLQEGFAGFAIKDGVARFRPDLTGLRAWGCCRGFRVVWESSRDQ